MSVDYHEFIHMTDPIAVAIRCVVTTQTAPLQPLAFHERNYSLSGKLHLLLISYTVCRHLLLYWCATEHHTGQIMLIRLEQKKMALPRSPSKTSIPEGREMYPTIIWWLQESFFKDVQRILGHPCKIKGHSFHHFTSLPNRKEVIKLFRVLKQDPCSRKLVSMGIIVLCKLLKPS